MKAACGDRMSESVELCIQISTPTTPRHHRDEELPMPNDRICRTVCTDQQLVNSSNTENLRIYTTVDTNPPRVSESIELLIQISTPTTPRHHRDEELPVANVRICRTVCTDQQLVNSPNIENLRIYTTVDTNPPRVSESIELLIQIDRGP